MSFSRTIKNIVNTWPTYLQKVKLDSNDPAFKEVVTVFPTVLKNSSPKINTLIFKGSTGATNITFAPWVAVFDSRITSSAQEGFYIVYLFSLDLKKLYLSLSLGTKQFQDFYKSKKNTFSSMRNVANVLTSLNINNKNFQSYKQGPINLLARKNATHEYYEQSTIYYKEYDIGNLPSDKVLNDDYLDILQRYQDMINDPTIPNISTLFHAQIQNVLPKNEPTISMFTPRNKKVKGTSNGKKVYQSTKSTYKSAADAKLIGDKGELIVLNYEKKKLNDAGRLDLAAKIIHEEANNNRPGWDITSYDLQGNKIYIEVKSTEAVKHYSFELTSNEYLTAMNSQFAQNYYIYLVTNVDTNRTPGIEILKNPMLEEKNKTIIIKPIRYQVDL